MDLYETLGILTYILLPIYAACVVLYLRAEKLNDGRSGFMRATALKTTCSCLFAATGIVSYVMSLESYAIRPDIYFQAQMLVVIGLLCCIPGDIFLQYIRLDERRYKIGIACFLSAQLLFFASLVLMNLLAGWLQTVLIAVGVLVVICVIMIRQRWKLRTEKRLITAYTIILSFVAAKAISNVLCDPTGGSLLMGIGAGLFLLSDVILGVWNYGNKGRGFAYANWIAYFSATMLIALSLSPLFDVPLGAVARFG